MFANISFKIFNEVFIQAFQQFMVVKHSNRLSNESSPYLLQHAGNPVDWYAWGDEALEAARSTGKPILVSIGYAACHWCHVMEKESFEVEEVAAVMNEHFINIKIDREERPDLDHIYMDAVQAIAGNGGWPLNVFLTPECKPFYGGTYFPPAAAYGRTSWTDVLLAIADSWKNRRDEIEAQANELIQHIGKSNNFASANSSIGPDQQDGVFTETDCRTIAQNLLKNADTHDGGFGVAPKFPQTFSIQYLLQFSHFFNDNASRHQALLSLRKMVDGGICDQLGGGMARYSTDAQWLAPHFEKMLYDNALLLISLCEAYQLTKDEYYSTAIKKTISFIERELKNDNGGYYAAIDADSEGVEGKFYVWDKAEIDALLKDDSEWYCAYYNIIESGNWEHSNILNVTSSLEEVAKRFQFEATALKARLAVCNQQLLENRNSRIRPITDDKILLGWNSLLLTAYSRAYACLQVESYKTAAVELYNFLESSFQKTGEAGLYHTFKQGHAKFYAFLDDYACFIQGCIALQEITAESKYLSKAKALTEYVIKSFSDDGNKYFFFTDAAQKDIVVRKLEFYDGAVPSGNSVMAGNLNYLSIVFNEASWKNRAIEMINGLKDVILKFPGSFGIWASALQQQVTGTEEIAISGKDVEQLLKDVLSIYLPNKILQAGTKDSGMDLLKGKLFNSDPLIYVCKDYQCFEPFHSAAALMESLKIK